MVFSAHLLLIALPFFCGFIISLIPGRHRDFISLLSYFFSLVICLLSVYLVYNSTGVFQLDFLPLGVDGLSLLLILLTSFLTSLCILSSWKIRSFQNFIVYFFCMEGCLFVVWSSLDLMLFYIFFESVLIPMLLIIGFWGSRERRVRASYIFFIYTLLGSVFMLLGIFLIISKLGTTDYLYIKYFLFDFNVEIFLWCTFFISFATKIPMLPFHIWLPEAHVEAPTSGSVILAGILLKLGGYGFMRYSLGLFPLASYFLSPIVFTIGVISIIYASLTAIRQNDLKRIIAYASIAHMNLIVLGIFSVNQNALEGAAFQMLSHGFVSSALFLCIGVLYDRHHTRLLKSFGGFVIVLPMFSIYFLFFTLANIAFPGTSSFIGEFLLLAGVFQGNCFIAFLASFGIILSGVYSMWLYNRIVFGNLKNNHNNYIDLTDIELFVLNNLLIVTLLVGILPEVFLIELRPSLMFICSNF